MRLKEKQEENCKAADTFIDLVERGFFGFWWVFLGVVGGVLLILAQVAVHNPRPSADFFDLRVV